MGKKGAILLIVSAVLLLSAGAGAVYFKSNNRQLIGVEERMNTVEQIKEAPSKPSSIVSEGEIMNMEDTEWLDYSDDEYKFTIKYPKGWKLSREDRSVQFRKRVSSMGFSVDILDAQGHRDVDDWFNSYLDSIVQYISPDNKAKRDTIELFAKDKQFIKIGDQDAIKVTQADMGGITTKNIYVLKDGYVLRLHYRIKDDNFDFGGELARTEHVRICEIAESSLGFWSEISSLNKIYEIIPVKNEGQNWNRYINKRHGFQIDIPNDSSWKVAGKEYFNKPPVLYGGIFLYKEIPIEKREYFSTAKDGLEIKLSISENKGIFEEWIAEERKEPLVKDIREININGIKAYYEEPISYEEMKRKVNEGADIMETAIILGPHIFFVKGDKKYSFEVISPSDPNLKQYDLDKLLDKIINTFKFIE